MASDFRYVKIDDTENWEPDFVSSLNGGRIIITYVFDRNNKLTWCDMPDRFELKFIGATLAGCSDEKAKYEIEFATRNPKDFERVIKCSEVKDDRPLPKQCDSLEEVIKLWENNPW